MLNITHGHRNANQNHNEILSHTGQDAAIQKSTSNKFWRKGHPLTLLVRMQTSTATMENSVEIP